MWIKIEGLIKAVVFDTVFSNRPSANAIDQEIPFYYSMLVVIINIQIVRKLLENVIVSHRHLAISSTSKTMQCL